MSDITIIFDDFGSYSAEEFKEKMLEYAKKLTSQKAKKKQRFEKFFGCMKINFDPLNVQKESRDEW